MRILCRTDYQDLDFRVQWSRRTVLPLTNRWGRWVDLVETVSSVVDKGNFRSQWTSKLVQQPRGTARGRMRAETPNPGLTLSHRGWFQSVHVYFQMIVELWKWPLSLRKHVRKCHCSTMQSVFTEGPWVLVYDHTCISGVLRGVSPHAAWGDSLTPGYEHGRWRI